MPADRHEVSWGRALDLPVRTMAYDQAYVWGTLEGSACSDLPAVAVDRYFTDASGSSFEAKTGKAICSRCVVVDECRTAALSVPYLPTSGVIGGVSASAIWNARSWRNYENGHTDSPPRVGRPEWLERPDSTEAAEEAFVMEDEL